MEVEVDWGLALALALPEKKIMTLLCGDHGSASHHQNLYAAHFWSGHNSSFGKESTCLHVLYIQHNNNSRSSRFSLIDNICGGNDDWN